eukprot:COSAG05_NODE_26141_length_190_cov_73.296703_1_plen_54_part_10
MMTEIHVGSCGVLHFVRVLLPLSSECDEMYERLSDLRFEGWSHSYEMMERTELR